MSQIPSYDKFMLPLLKMIGDSNEHNLKECMPLLADQFNLTEEQRAVLLPSGTQTFLSSRIGWARTYLKKAGLLVSPKKGLIKITEQGIKLLEENPTKLDSKDLERFDGFKEFKYGRDNNKSASSEMENNESPVNTMTPEEALEFGYESYNKKVADELLTSLYEVTPDQFEQIVVDLLVKMGYGGSRKEAGQVLGKTGDEGIDGVIKEDKLGLDAIYIQAKRWTGNTVGRPLIQQFVGALSGKKARKGVYITTSSYTSDAIEYVKHLEQKVILIDGQKLVELMLEYNLGVSTERVIEIKKIDSDYFNEE